MVQLGSTAAPLVSAIVPTYNRLEYLDLALHSIASQTFDGPIEVIVVDGSEGDSVRSILEEQFPEYTYIKVVNNGPAMARQIGGERARGKYIAYLDDDDLWQPEKLALQVAFLDAHPEIDLAFHDARKFDQTGDFRRTVYQASPELWTCPHRTLEGTPPAAVFEPGVLTGIFLTGSPLFTNTILAQRTFLERIGGWDGSIPANGETQDFSTRAAFAGRIGYLDAVLARIRRSHADRLTNDELTTRAQECDQLLRVESGWPPELRRQARPAMARRMAQNGWLFYKARQRKQAHRYYGQAMRHGCRDLRVTVKWLWSWAHRSRLRVPEGEAPTSNRT